MKPPDQTGRALTQVTPRVGWEPDREKQIEQLCILLAETHPTLDASNQHQLCTRLLPLFAKATALIEVSSPEEAPEPKSKPKPKPTTFIRDQITALLTKSEEDALRHLEQPDPVLADYLDLNLEANDPDFPSVDVASTPEEFRAVARKRYDLLKNQGERLIPMVETGPEAVWPTMAELIAELLIDITGEWPGRVVGVDDKTEGKELGWGLLFFQAFAKMVVSTLPPRPPGKKARKVPIETRYVQVWRKALSRLEAAGRRPKPPPRRRRAK